MVRSPRSAITTIFLAVLATVLLLTAPASAATDPNEPTDNQASGATKSYFGVPVEGYLGHAGDVDYFYIDVPSRWSPHHVTVGLSQVPTDHDWTLEVALADPASPGELTWVDWPVTKPWPGRVEMQSDPDVEDARLYVKIHSAGGGDFSADKAYRLQVLWTYTVDSFPDVAAGHLNHDAIIGVARLGFVEGYANGKFGPDDKVMRQQFAKMVSIYAGLALQEGVPCPFTDVVGDWPYPSGFVTAAAKAEIIKGYPGALFKPYNDITIAQVITMSMRGVEPWLDPVPDDYAPPFSAFDDGTHYQHARFASYYGLLTGLPTNVWSQPATRGQCAQMLWNLCSMSDPALPMFADLEPAGPVGFTFAIDTPIIWAAEHEDDGIWDKTLPASTITGHAAMQLLAVAGGQATAKLTVDSLTLPNNTQDAQATLAEILPAYVLLRLDDQGAVLGISYKTKDKPEQVLDQTMVAGLATFLTPFTSALMLPYSGQLAKPGDHLGFQKTYTSLGKKTMDVDTQVDYLSFASGVARLGFDLAVTKIDIPLRFDMRPIMPLLGYDGPTGTKPWTLDLNVGTTVLANGQYHLDTASGLPTGMTLTSTMMLDAWIHEVPSQELLKIWPNSDFAHGWVDHAYLRAADRVSPITVTLSMTKDAAQ